MSSSWTFDETVAEQKCPENGSKRVKKDKVERVRGVFFGKLLPLWHCLENNHIYLQRLIECPVRWVELEKRQII